MGATASSPSTELYRARAGTGRLLLAAARGAASQPVLSAIVALIAGAVVVITLATAGRAVSTERAVLARFDALDITVVQVLDDEGDAGLDAADVARVQRLTGVDWAVGLGPVVDVRTAGLRGEPVPSRVVVGASDLLHIAAPASVQAYVSTASGAALGLPAASGAVETASGRQLPVAGWFTATGPLAGLADSVVVVDDAYDGPIRRLYVDAADPESVVAVAAAVAYAVGDRDRDGNRPRVEVSDDVALIRAAVRGELGGANRAIILQALGAGLVLGALTIFAGVQARRRDFGRRRALGATRTQLVRLVVLQMLLVAIPGAAVGAAVGAVVAERLSGSWPGWRYPLAVAVLAVLSVAAAALPPAVVAAFRDPVRAIRVP